MGHVVSRSICSPTSEKTLSEILKDESGDGGKKKKQKIGHKLSGHYDQELRHIFSLGEGFKHEKFNNLALDKIRKDRDNTEDLGKYRRDLMGHGLIFACFSINWYYIQHKLEDEIAIS